MSTIIGIDPYYQDDYCTIYHGDCRGILSQLEPVDLVLTDPPYGIKEAAGKNKSRSKLAIARDYGFYTWDNETKPEELLLALGLSSRSIVFGGNYYSNILPPSSCWLVWDKANGDNDFADCELAWTNLPQAVRLRRHSWHGMIRKGQEERFHPTQKPLDLIKWCIRQADKHGANEIIIDPFMGSGTTLRAAKDFGRKAIGIEIEEKYCEIAVKRLRQGVLNFGESK